MFEVSIIDIKVTQGVSLDTSHQLNPIVTGDFWLNETILTRSWRPGLWSHLHTTPCTTPKKPITVPLTAEGLNKANWKFWLDGEILYEFFPWWCLQINISK